MTAKIAFIGLGRMGGSMALNLQHTVIVHFGSTIRSRRQWRLCRRLALK